MKEYRKHRTEWLIFVLLFMAMTIVYCTSKPEIIYQSDVKLEQKEIEKARLDSIDKIRTDTTDTTIALK